MNKRPRDRQSARKRDTGAIEHAEDDLESRTRNARKALALLADAIALVESPRSWTRKGYALDGRGRQVRVDDPQARRFCTIGAVLRAEHDRNETPMPIETDPHPDIDDFNLPVAPEAPAHLWLALQALGQAALDELRASAKPRSRPLTPTLTLAHLPMLVGRVRSTGHANALTVLVRASARMAVLGIGDRAQP